LDETDVRQKIFKLARTLGYWPITSSNTTVCPRCKSLVLPTIGRPDILWLNPRGAGRVSECKVLRQKESAFSFSEVTQDQKDWLDRWQEDGGIGYIAFGVIRPAGKLSHLERLYLVDWAAWRGVERLVVPTQNSIPYIAGPGFARALQDNRYDIVTLLRPWELERDQGCWHLPLIHSARQGDRQ